MGKTARILLSLLATASLLMLLAARPAGDFLGGKFAAAILAAGKGKVSHPANFVTGRISEAGWLLGLAVLLVLLYFAVRRALGTRSYSWAPLAVCAFAGINLWLLAAMNAGLFWAAFYTGSATSNFTQFNFKKLLLKEHDVPRQILLLGSSQTQAQLDERVLNERLKGRAWTTELHFPGSHPLDMLLVLRRLRGQPGEEIVVYLSEYYFYSGLESTAPPFFLSATDLPVLARLGWGPELRTRTFAMGLLAEALPVFACREPFSHRLLGIALSSIEQARHDSSLETNLVERAEATAGIFKLDAAADLQKKTFEEFVREAAKQKRRLVLLEGQVNPLLGQRIPAQIRADMKKFIRKVASENEHVVLIPEEELPAQRAELYADLTHVTSETQQRFSHWFADLLERRATLALSQRAP